MTAHSDEDSGRRDIFSLLVGVRPLWKSVEVPQTLETDLPQDPAILLLGIYLKDSVPHYRGTCSFMFLGALCITARKWKYPRCPSPGG